MTALWLRTTLWKQLLGHPRAMPGAWGRFALHRILPRKEFMGRRSGRRPARVPTMPKTKALRDETKYRLLPPLDPDTYSGLKANIGINGVQVPIVRDEKG